MKKIIIQYPDGSNHEVTVERARRCVNLVTGNLDIVIEYKDHTDKIDDCYTSIVNVLGKWYKNPNHAEWNDYLFYENNEEEIIRELPSTMKSYEDAVYRVNKEDSRIKYYVTDIMEKIINMIKTKNPGLLESPRINNLLHRLGEMLMKAYNRFFNDDGQHREWNISFMMRWQLVENIYNSLDSEESLARELDRAIDVYEPFTRGYYSIKSRNEQVSQIVRELRIIELYVPGVDFRDVILNLRNLNIIQMNPTMFESFIKEINDVLNRRDVFTGDWTVENMRQIGVSILQVIWKYQDLLKNKKKDSEPFIASPVSKPLFPPNPDPPRSKHEDKMYYVYKINVNSPKISKIYDYQPKYSRKHYVALSPASVITGSEKAEFQSFEVIREYPADSSEINYYFSSLASNGVNMKNVISDYVKKIRTKFLNEGILCTFPLYIEWPDGITDVCYFGICETEEKFMDVARAFQIDVFVPDDCPFREGSLCESSFRNAMEGKYAMQIVDGKYYGSFDNNDIENRRTGRR